MSDRNLVEQLGSVLKKSRGEPSKFIELIVCIRDLNRQGKIASCSKIVRKLWFEEWTQAEDKVSFEKVKWDLLCKRRRAINNRVLKSDLCFDFYIELSPEKQFILIHDREEIYRKRAEELERNLAKAGSESLRERIQAAIVQLDHQYRQSAKGETAARTTARRWTAAGVMMVLAITVSVLFIRNIYFHSPPAKNHFIEKQSSPAVFSGALTIAVQPFRNMSDDPQQESFSKGLTEEIVTTLSKLPAIDVIDSHSTLAYDEKTVDVKQVRQKIDTRYVLQGSIRKTRERARISAQLSDAATGHHLWADRWDMDLDDIFAVQDEITMNIVTELVAALQSGAHVRLFARSTRNLEAFTNVLSGYHYFFQGTLDNTYCDMQRYEDAITYLEKFMRLKPKAVIESLHLAASYEAVGRDEEAQAIIRKVLRKDPTMTVEKVLRRLTPKKGKEPSKNEQLLSDQLRRAGLP